MWVKVLLSLSSVLVFFILFYLPFNEQVEMLRNMPYPNFELVTGHLILHYNQRGDEEDSGYNILQLLLLQQEREGDLHRVET